LSHFFSNFFFKGESKLITFAFILWHVVVVVVVVVVVAAVAVVAFETFFQLFCRVRISSLSGVATSCLIRDCFKPL
jgi:hypothetical protein